MIRVLLKSKFRHENGLEGEDHFTHDVDCPSLEKLLTSGGFSENTYLRVSAIALEVRPDELDGEEEKETN